MTDADVKAQIADLQALALTMFGEARGDVTQGGSSVEERIAVGCTVRNRVARKFRGDSFTSNCLARSQYSCWWTWGGKANYAIVIGIAHALLEKLPFPTLSAVERSLFDESMFLAEGIIGGQLLDRVHGATHYYAPDAMIPKGSKPEWAIGSPQAQVGRQLFFTAA